MGTIGVFLVGVVLLVNGLVLLNKVPARSAAPLNLFVGAIQIVFPTIILVQRGGYSAVVAATWPTYLFGITYLYYGLNIIFDIEPEGFGWFCGFVAIAAAYQAATTAGSDPIFAVIWLTWAIMWTLFFALLALDAQKLTRFSGWFLVLLGVPSCSISSIFLLEGTWSTSAIAGLAALAVLGVATVSAVVLSRIQLRTAPLPAAGGAELVAAPGLASPASAEAVPAR